MATSKLGRTLVVCNPAAQSGKGAQGGAFVQRTLDAYSSAVSGYSYYETTSPGDGLRKAKAAKNYDTVIAVGGDGLIHEIVNGLMAIPAEKRPRLGLVPMGSGNDYARTLHLALNDPMASLGQTINGTPVKLDLGLVNGVYFCETCSFGLDAAIALDTMKTRVPGGPHGTRLFAQSGYRIFKNFTHGYKYKATVDGTSFSGEEIAFACQVGPTYGGGYHICPKASPVDGLLNLCYNTKIPSKPAILALFTGARMGLHAKSSVIAFKQFKKFKVTFEKQPPCQVDGEPLEGSTFEITSVPAALEVLVPNSSQWNPNPTKVDRPSVTDGLLGTKLADKLRNSSQE